MPFDTVLAEELLDMCMVIMGILLIFNHTRVLKLP